MERFDDALEHRVDDDFGMFLGEVGDSGDFLHELRLRHAAGPSVHGDGAPYTRGRGLGKGSGGVNLLSTADFPLSTTDSESDPQSVAVPVPSLSEYDGESQSVL